MAVFVREVQGVTVAQLQARIAALEAECKQHVEFQARLLDRKGQPMTEYEIAIVEALHALKDDLRNLVSEIHDLGKDVLLVRSAINEQTKLLYEQGQALKSKEF